jgi:Stage II sporulation protein E (SpoIIE)
MRGRERTEIDVYRDLRIMLTVVALSVDLALRLAAHVDLGAIELIPILLGAFWFGLPGARFTALAAAATLCVGTAVNETFDPLTLLVRIPLIIVLAEVIGRLLADRETKARQLQMLRSIQDALAPSVAPELPLLEIATGYVPAEGQLAGDFYLVAQGHNESAIVVVGDVVGKGMDAARRAAFIRATLNASTAYSDDPVHLLRTVNAELVRQYGVSWDFITMLCVVVHADASLAWASAGHPSPISLADGMPLGDTPPCYPVGIAPELTGITVSRAELPDEGILLYTDGLSDARPRGYQPFGEGRIAALLGDLDQPTPQQAVDSLIAAARRFSAGALPDDICLVALRSRLPRRLPSPHIETLATPPLTALEPPLTELEPPATELEPPAAIVPPAAPDAIEPAPASEPTSVK